MFNFLHDWDISLEEYIHDMDGSIKGEVKSWVVYAQMYCERLLKIFNKQENIIKNTDRLALGDFLGDFYFIELFRDKTKFYDVNGLKRLNALANDIKHNGKTKEYAASEIVDWYKFLHTLSIKTFNYMKRNTYTEEFKVNYIEELIKSADEAVMQTADYADQVILKKNQIIEGFIDDLKVMNDFASEDQEKIKKLELENERLQEELEKNNEALKSFELLVESLFKESRSNKECNSLETIKKIQDIGTARISLNSFNKKIDTSWRTMINSDIEELFYSIEKESYNYYWTEPVVDTREPVIDYWESTHY